MKSSDWSAFASSAWRIPRLVCACFFRRIGRDRGKVSSRRSTRIPGERSLRAQSCAELASATALVLALRVDPSLVSSGAPQASSAASPSVVAPNATSVPVAPGTTAAPASPNDAKSASVAEGAGAKPAVAPDSADSRQTAPLPPAHPLVVGLSALGELGDLPSPEVGGEVIAGWTHGGWRVELRAATGVVQHTDVAGHSHAGWSRRAFSGGGRVCYSAPPSFISVAACALGEVDWQWASFDERETPTTLVRHREADAGWPALGGGALAVWRVAESVGVRVSVDAVVPLTHPIGTPPGFLSQAGAVVGRAGLGVEVRFF